MVVGKIYSSLLREIRAELSFGVVSNGLKSTGLTGFKLEVDALQSLWAAWNMSTPNPSANLAGWMSSGGKTFYPCNTDIDIKWRGVTCLQHQQNASTLISWIIGLFRTLYKGPRMAAILRSTRSFRFCSRKSLRQVILERTSL